MPILLIAIFALAFGSIVGSFLNVVIYRVPREESIVFPGSHCTSCGEHIAWYDNVPILSYLLLRGRCRHCGAHYSARYLLVEALSGAAAVLLVLVPVLGDYFWRPAVNLPFFAFIAALIVVAFIDIDFKIIPDRISLPGIPLGLLVSGLLSPVGWADSLIGIMLGGGSLLLVALGYYALTRKEGMGMGDVKLLAMIGAWLGWMSIPFILVTASFVGALIGGLILLRGRGTLKAQVPFGPFLAGAALVYLFAGVQITRLYVDLLAGSG
ncbi:MAG: prepilin peptidase [Candidatus Alcyoniella australis]|nr:prepilin peptidase [Candidatus Alcyoniella australis]